MAEAADALHGDEIAWHRAAVAQSIEGGDASAKQRSGVSRIKAVRNMGHGFDGSDHIFLIAAVVADSSDRAFLAIDEITCATGWACVVLAAMPADAGAVPFLPSGYTGAHLINHASDFMSWSSGELHSWQ